MTTITWKIDNIECKLQEGEYADVVYIVHWRANARSGEAATSRYGSVTLEFTGGDFIPFEDLLEETVIGWVKDALGTDVVDGIETSLSYQIATLLAPTIASKPLPWS